MSQRETWWIYTTTKNSHVTWLEHMFFLFLFETFSFTALFLSCQTLVSEARLTSATVLLLRILQLFRNDIIHLRQCHVGQMRNNFWNICFLFSGVTAPSTFSSSFLFSSLKSSSTSSWLSASLDGVSGRTNILKKTLLIFWPGYDLLVWILRII